MTLSIRSFSFLTMICCFLVFQQQSSIFCRAHSDIMAKGACEVGGTFKAAMFSDLLDLQSLVGKHLLCHFAACPVDVGNERITCISVKFARQIVFADSNKGGNILQGKILVASCVDIVDGLLGVQNATVMAVMAIVLLRGVAVILAKQQQKL